MADDTPRYFAGSSAFADRDPIRPGQGCAVAIVGRAGDAYPTLGIGFPHVHLAADPEAGVPAEAGWRLMVGGSYLPGVWVLRRGEFARFE